MTKKLLKQMVAHAYEMKAATYETEVVFQIYSDSIYVLDTEEDNIIDCVQTEQEAISLCNGINSGEFSAYGGRSECYYKPILIDADTGERVTRTNFMYYDLKSEWVKNFIQKTSEALSEYNKSFTH